MAELQEFLQEGAYPEHEVLISNFVRDIEIMEDEEVLA